MHCDFNTLKLSHLIELKWKDSMDIARCKRMLEVPGRFFSVNDFGTNILVPVIEYSLTVLVVSCLPAEYVLFPVVANYIDSLNLL